MMCTLRCFLGFALTLSLALFSVYATAKQPVGWIETVRIFPGGVDVRAKIDTGATTSSLNCACIRPEVINGERWVHFTVTNYKDQSVALRRKVLRVAKIKRHDEAPQERYVVLLGVCLQNVFKEVQVTLTDRSNFDYQMLVGRNFLRGDFLVDPGAKFKTKPECEHVPEKQ